MLKLYKRTDTSFYYWETWEESKKTAVIHWGVVGEHGQDKEVKSKTPSGFREQIQQEINQLLEDGYEPVERDKHYLLLIEFVVEGMGTAEDLAKRARLQARLDETLGWTGLGHCDGGSIGSGSMDVCCFVVDFAVAKQVIEDDLRETEFATYSRIYQEE
ncbi:hypothetical protein [Hymenobacter sp. YC55]|uniref:hypothetical protein n=1 Tax=Hymenobacter sp. YC55 TaxID=3034019 RepID=UPI0023F98C0A|nr:hypothetical protein [Hymenobacter sp. YC55]MDF7815911.1 hypothetical protein [Hymenobacter sp. YC55]